MEVMVGSSQVQVWVMILEGVFFTIHFNLKEILPLYLQVFDKSRSARECGRVWQGQGKL